MSKYIRVKEPGHYYFFTVVTAQRKPVFDSEESVAVLRQAFRRVKSAHPFRVDAVVVLPDHIHAIWKLPETDSDYSTRWRLIKNFVSQKIKTGSPLWQPRYWEHCIRDPNDWQRHCDYIHYNPVKHGLVTRVIDWPYSSFERNCKRGWYKRDWGSNEPSSIAGMHCE